MNYILADMIFCDLIYNSVASNGRMTGEFCTRKYLEGNIIEALVA
jgi:hypothetical protein